VKPEPGVPIRSKYSFELTTKITVDNVSYIVHTEEKGKGYTTALSRVFSEGKIVLSQSADYSQLVDLKEVKARLSDFMESLHRSVIEEFTSSLLRKQKKKNEYFKQAKELLRKNKGEDALAVLQEGLNIYPADPFLLSYYGCLCSIVANKPKEGIRICRDAIKKLNQTIPLGKENFYPTFYLNLGRAYLAAGKKSEAVTAIDMGLKADPEDSELLNEKRQLGVRRKPPVPFLRRGNPINKYIGGLLHRVAK
jgi:tetratricopeptide (TPR) repeat protein